MDAQFFLVSNYYYRRFKDPSLMANKIRENGNYSYRPFLFGFPDFKQPDIFWVIPISSQVAKYRKIAKEKEKRFGECETIVFGEVSGKEAAFLIQNMIPVTGKWAHPFPDEESLAMVDEKIVEEVVRSAKATFSLAKEGVHVFHADVFRIFYNLLKGNAR